MFKRFIAVMVVGIVAGLSLLAPAASADPRHENHDGRFIIICFVDRNRDGFGSNSFFSNGFGSNSFDNNGFGSNSFDSNGFGSDSFFSNGFGGNLFDNNGFDNNGFGSDSFVRVFHHGDLVCFVIRRDHQNDGRNF